MVATEKLEALGRAIAETGNDAVDARVRPPLEERLAALRDRRALRGESLRRPISIGLALGAVAAAVILWPRALPLTFAVGEPTIAGEIGAWVVAPPTRTMPVTFSDGTRVDLEGGSRVRVLGASANGARIAIERGGVRADVIPRAGNTWSVVGGPFEIHVTGTSFDARWDPEREVLDVHMREGRVVVRAPCLERDRALIAGESASLSCASPRDRGSALPSPSVTATATAMAPRGSRAVEARPSGASADEPPPAIEPQSAATTTPSTWRDLARRGDYKGAIAIAEAEGWGALCSSLPASDLFELGTTARLAGQRARAIEAYSAVRARFGGGEPAANAAFHLGQMAFDGARAFGEAHRWFSVYLAERPGGALAAEALGRAMEAEQRLGDLTAARATAQRYLARFPSGAHADLAKSLLAP